MDAIRAFTSFAAGVEHLRPYTNRPIARSWNDYLTVPAGIDGEQAALSAIKYAMGDFANARAAVDGAHNVRLTAPLDGVLKGLGALAAEIKFSGRPADRNADRQFAIRGRSIVNESIETARRTLEPVAKAQSATNDIAAAHAGMFAHGH